MWGHALLLLFAHVCSLCVIGMCLRAHFCRSTSVNMRTLVIYSSSLIFSPPICLHGEPNRVLKFTDGPSLTHTETHAHTFIQKESDRDSLTNTSSPICTHTRTHFLKGSQTTHKVCMVATESGLGCACVCTRASVCVLEVASIQTRAQLFIHHSVDGVLSSSNGLKSPTPPTHTPTAPNTLCTSATN